MLQGHVPMATRAVFLSQASLGVTALELEHEGPNEIQLLLVLGGIPVPLFSVYRVSEHCTRSPSADVVGTFGGRKAVPGAAVTAIKPLRERERERLCVCVYIYIYIQVKYR